MYFDLLGDLELGVLQAAAKRAALEHRYPSLPPAGLIRQHAADLVHPPLPAAKAWEQACVVARRWGEDLVFRARFTEKTRQRIEADLARLDPRARAAAEAYGWRNVVEAQPGVGFAQFRNVYESLDGAERREAALPPALRLPAVAKALAGVGAMPKLG